MNMVPLALEGAWKVLAAGLVLGAGLPILYAFAVRGLAMAAGGTAIVGGRRMAAGVQSDKDWTVTILLSVLVGGLGMDRFYLGSWGLGLGKLLTGGGLGVWSLVDMILAVTKNMRDVQGRLVGKPEPEASDEDVHGATPNVAGKILAGPLLLVILLAVSYGIRFIVAPGAGKVVTFDQIIPWFVAPTQ